MGNSTLVRLIDTPGVGDTRGIGQDKKNLEDILRMINSFRNLHSICVLLKSDTTRFTLSFKYCLDQLFSQLHQNVSKNIVFIFTHGKSVDYRPGSAVTIVKKFLDDVKQKQQHIDIELTQTKYYVIENDSFGHLIARKKGFNYLISEQDLEKSWTRSSQECKRLLENVMKFIPHNTSDTININEVREVLVNLMEPLADIFENLDNNLTFWEEKKLKIAEAKFNIELFRGLIITQSIEVEMKKLDKPNLVCASNQCRTTYNVGGFTKYKYTQTCCNKCGRLNHLLGHGDNVKFESKSLLGTKYCSKCGCPEKEHKIVNYDSFVVLKENPDLKAMLKIFEDTLSDAEKSMKTFEEMGKFYELEKQVILQSTAIFANFLQKNAIVPLKDYFKEKLEQRITDAQLQKASDKEVDNLRKTLQAYEAQVESNKSLDVSTKDVLKTKQGLCSLKLYGEKIKQIYSLNEQAFKSDKPREDPPVKFNNLVLNRLFPNWTL
jgi:hypothetical protein